MDIKALKQQYDENGFIKVKGLFSVEKVEEIKTELRRYEREILPSLDTKDYVLEADGKSVRNLWRLNKNDPYFKKLSETKDLRELVGALVNGEPEIKGVETFNKPAMTGSGVPPHQDNAYFCQTPPDMLTIWVAIDRVTKENGPVTYLSGSHNCGHLPHKPSGVSGNSMGLAELPSKETYPEWEGLLEPGDALIHHCEVVHYSAPNRTDKPRCGMLMVCRGLHTETSEELMSSYRTGGAV